MKKNYNLRMEKIIEVIRELDYEHKDTDEILISIKILKELKGEIERLQIREDVLEKRLTECRISRDNAVSKLVNSKKYIKFDEKI